MDLVGIRLAALTGFFAACSTLVAQPPDQISNVRDVNLSGTVQSWNLGELTMIDADGKSQTFKIQTDPASFISVNNGKVILNEPAKVNVTGRASMSALRPGMPVRVKAELGAAAKTDNATRLEVVPPNTLSEGIEFENGPPAAGQLAQATIIGRVLESDAERTVVAVPRHEFAPRQQISFDTSHLPEIEFRSTTLGNVRPGDVISKLLATEISSGELIVRDVEIQVVDVIQQFAMSVDRELELKYWHLSDKTVAPREVRSQHFLMRTDMSERQASILLEKLETMVELISSYYGSSIRQPITCIVVEDLKRWDLSEFDRRGVSKIQQGEGITLYGRVGRRAEAVVYSAADHGVVQHESVHAFCYLAFGSTGPLWYAEGMAEIGQYWRPGELAVRMDPAILGYLTSGQPQSLAAIIAADQINMATWQAYAWRWTVCHMLVHNPNYSREFKQLGLRLMKGNRQASFQSAFGSVAQEITFEYEQFWKHLKNGFRVDLCAWDWNVRANPLGRRTKSTQVVVAARGWQPTQVRVEAGQTYEITTEGKWKLEENGPDLSADGDPNGAGRLVATIFENFELSEPIQLGSQIEFVSPQDGQLCLRCHEDFSRIADNSGEISVTITKVEKDK